MTIFDSLAVYKPLLHLVFPVTMFVFGLVGSLLAAVDVTVGTLCGGGDQCAEVINLNSVKSATAALGTMFFTPWIGSLSDKYGRRPFFMILFAINAIPNAILAFSTTKLAVYAFYGIGTLVLMLGEGSISTLFYAYVADTIPTENRPSGFGFVGAFFSFGFFAGTISARFIPQEVIFLTSVIGSATAVLYIAFVMPETLPSIALKKSPGTQTDLISDPLLSKQKAPILQRSPSTVREALSTISNSHFLTIIVAVAFLSNLADVGLQGNLLYVLKAIFHWSKDEFSLVLMLSGLGLGLGQVLILPWLSSIVNARVVLLVGLFFGSLHTIIFGVSSASWMVFVAASLTCFSGIASPMIGSIVSTSGSAAEQGLLQGVVVGIKSLSSIISSILINQITALFLSDAAPFDCPGFGIVVAGMIQAAAFSLVLFLPSSPKKREVLISSPVSTLHAVVEDEIESGY